MPSAVKPLRISQANASDGVDGSRSRHRNVPHGALSHCPMKGAIHSINGGQWRDRRLLVKMDQHVRAPSRTSLRTDLAMNRADRRGDM